MSSAVDAATPPVVLPLPIDLAHSQASDDDQISLPPSPRVAPVSAKLYDPEDLMPAWKLTLKKIGELVLQILVPIGIILIAHALLPITFCAVALPFIAFSAVFATAFMFISRDVTPEAAPVRPVRPQVVIEAPVQEIAPESPLGLANYGNNCWINSLSQLFRADKNLLEWFQSVPKPIANFQEAAVGLPRELLFTAEELADHKILPLVPFNPPLNLPPLPENFVNLPDERKLAFRAYTDERLLEWVMHVPEFAWISVDDIFSDKILDEVVPADLFAGVPDAEQSKRVRNAKELVQKLRARDQEQRNQQKTLISWMRPTPLPVNFADATPEVRANFREASDVKIIRWLSSIQESNLIPHNPELLFSETPIDQILTDAVFAGIPPEHVEPIKQNAELVITKLRQIIAAEQMTFEEFKSLVEKIIPYDSARDVTNLDEKIALIDRLELYKSSIDLIAFFQGHNVTDIPAQWLLLDEIPEVLDQWFETLPEGDRADEKTRVIELIQAIQNDPIIFKFFFEAANFHEAIARFSDEERQNMLRYLTVIHSAEDKKGAVEFLLAHQNFFAGYDAAKNNNERVSYANSQQLRMAYHRNFPSISQFPRQEDAAEAFAQMGFMLPQDFKVLLDERRIYETEGMPLMRETPDGIRTKPDLNHGILTLKIVGEKPNLTQMLATFMKSDEGGDVASLPDVDGTRHDYQLKSLEYQFETAPQSLWPAISRFEYKAPTSFMRSVFPCFFPTPRPRSMKITTPVELPDVLEIETLHEGIVSYKLDGFIVHLGSSMSSGHYISYKLEINEAGEEVWYEMDDRSVKKVEGGYLERKKAQAYLPHYSRI